MSFTLFNGRATWDNAGKASVVAGSGVAGGSPGNGSTGNTGSNSGDTSSSGSTSTSGSDTNIVVGTNPPPVVSTNPPPITTNAPPAATNFPGSTVVDYLNLTVPDPGSYELHVLSPTLLELKLIGTKDQETTPVTQWDLVNGSIQFTAAAANLFAVTADNTPVAVSAVGFKRRPLFAPLKDRELRIDNSLYLQLSSPLSDNQVVKVVNPGGALWGNNLQFTATVDPLRYSPAIHVNQEGYMPNFAKKAMVGYYTGSLGEMSVPSLSFKLVDAHTGATVYQGSLAQRLDTGWNYSPAPYQKVYEADFTSYNTPGQYRLVVPGLGASRWTSRGPMNLACITSVAAPNWACRIRGSRTITAILIRPACRCRNRPTRSRGTRLPGTPCNAIRTTRRKPRPA
jgi:hypothetical protein